MDLAKRYFEAIKPNWVYHCIVSPKTNQIQKPEWYVHLTLKYIEEHIELIRIETKDSDEALLARKSFISHMIELVKIRLHQDMSKLKESLQKDRHSGQLLVHTYNEIIKFVKIVRQLLSDPKDLEDMEDLMDVFADQALFEEIDRFESDYSRKNLNDIISSENAWDFVLEGDYTDNYKIPRCVDRFLLQIQSVSERVDCFRQLDCKFQLIDLQCSLFDRMLLFMKNTEPTVSKSIISDMFLLSDASEINLSRTAKVINGINFLRLILKERCFLTKADLNKELNNKLRKTTEDYESYFDGLIEKFTKIYEQCDSNLKEFLDFIQPKLARDIFVLVEDEVTKKYQNRHTQTMFKKSSLGRE